MTIGEFEPHGRVAALQLVIHDEPLARWEMAVSTGQSIEELDGDSFFGYGVDTGTGLLADLRAVRALDNWDSDEFARKSRDDEPRSATHGVVTDAESGANIFTVESGYGDGFYPTFVGYTADGRVASFVTDFLVVPREEVAGGGA